MEESEQEKQRNMVTRSSIKRKPFANLTNIVRKPYPISPFSQSKKPGSSTASESSIGSTQNPIHEYHQPLISPPNQPLPSTPPRLTPAQLGGDEIAYTQKRSTRKTSSKSKEVNVPLCSSTIEKIKDTNHTKNTKNTINTSLLHSTMKTKDKGKQIAVQSNYPQLENTNINLPHSSLKKKDKGKSIAVSFNHHLPMKTKMVEVLPPSSGVFIKDKGKTVKISSNVGSSQKDHGNVAVTPVNHKTLKKDKASSCPPLLRTAINRNRDVGVEDSTFQLKLQTEPPPNKKKRHSSKESVEEYVLPQDFVEQQRAYFKEIDDFELEVEEV